jgi:hypothetical protein
MNLTRANQPHPSEPEELVGWSEDDGDSSLRSPSPPRFAPLHSPPPAAPSVPSQVSASHSSFRSVHLMWYNPQNTRSTRTPSRGRSSVACGPTADYCPPCCRGRHGRPIALLSITFRRRRRARRRRRPSSWVRWGRGRVRRRTKTRVCGRLGTMRTRRTRTSRSRWTTQTTTSRRCPPRVVAPSPPLQAPRMQWTRPPNTWRNCSRACVPSPPLSAVSVVSARTHSCGGTRTRRPLVTGSLREDLVRGV